MSAQKRYRRPGIYRRPRQGPGRLGQLRPELPRPAAHRQEPLVAGVPHGRPQAAARGRCRRRAGHRLLRLGGRGRRRRSMRSRRGSKTTGTKVARGSRALADERHVKDLIVANDPAGNRLEFFHGAADRVRSVQARPQHLRLPHRPARHGPRGDALRAHRRGDAVLSGGAGVQAQRLLAAAVPGYFFHVNPRHHSLAFVETGKNMVHHMMVELFSFDDVGQGYDLALGDPEKIARDARPPLRRLRHVVLHLEPVGLHGRVRLGRAGDRRQHLEAVRAQARPEPVGPRPHAGCRRRSARRRASSASRRPRTACASRCR